MNTRYQLSLTVQFARPAGMRNCHDGPMHSYEVLVGHLRGVEASLATAEQQVSFFEAHYRTRTEAGLPFAVVEAKVREAHIAAARLRASREAILARLAAMAPAAPATAVVATAAA